MKAIQLRAQTLSYWELSLWLNGHRGALTQAPTTEQGLHIINLAQAQCSPKRTVYKQLEVIKNRIIKGNPRPKSPKQYTPTKHKKS